MKCLYEGPSMVPYTFNSSTQQAEEGGFLCVLGHSGQHRGFPVSQSYTVRCCLKTQNKQNQFSLPMSNYFKRYHANEDLFNICMYVCVCVSSLACVPHLHAGVYAGQKRVSSPLELGLERYEPPC